VMGCFILLWKYWGVACGIVFHLLVVGCSTLLATRLSTRFGSKSGPSPFVGDIG